MKRTLFGLFASFLACFSGAQMLPDSIEYFLANGTSFQSIPYKTSIFTYDAEDKVIEETIRSSWKLKERWEFTYLNGELSEKTQYLFNKTTSGWDPNAKTTTFFNAAGLDKGFIEYAFVKSKNDWEIRTCYLYALTWDSLNRLTERLTFFGNHILSPDTSHLQVYTYQEADNLPDSVSSYSLIDGVWVDGIRFSQVKWECGFDYRLSSSKAPTHMKVHHFTDGAWKVTSFDSGVVVDGKIVERYLFMNNVNDSFALASNGLYEYDGVGNRISFKEYVYYYDVIPSGSKASGNYEEIDYIYNGTTNDILQEIRTEFDGWYSKEKVLYHYPPGMMGVKRHQAANLIYPNPVSSSQRLFVENADQVNEAVLYSPNGKLLRSWTEIDQQGLELDGLAAGIYFILLLDEEGNTSTQRLFIK